MICPYCKSNEAFVLDGKDYGVLSGLQKCEVCDLIADPVDVKTDGDWTDEAKARD